MLEKLFHIVQTMMLKNTLLNSFMVYYEVCQFGYYGQSCKEKCSEHCRHANDCDHVTGVCSNGCFDGWLGKYCDQSV